MEKKVVKKTTSTKNVNDAKVMNEKAVETKADVKEVKAVAPVKPETKKTTAKTTTKKAPAKTTKAVKEAVKKEEIFLQFGGLEFSDNDLVEKVKADYIASTGKKIFKNVKLYVKPEEMMVYYVVNEKYLGKVSL